MLVDKRQCCVRGGKSVVVDLAVDICGICGVNEWHVTIDTFLRRFGVVEGQGTLM